MKVELEWIACSERLPDDESTVLIAYDGDCWQGYHLGEDWRELDGCVLPSALVTHWAQLPPVPGEAVNGEGGPNG